MPGSKTEIPIRCGRCGFAFALPDVDKPVPVCCPSCGDEFVCMGRCVPLEKRSASRKSKGTKASANTTASASGLKRKSGETGVDRRWGILFLAVCVQFVVLILSPMYIYNRIREEGSPHHTASRSSDSETTAETPFAGTSPLLLPASPPAVIAVAEPRVARKADVFVGGIQDVRESDSAGKSSPKTESSPFRMNQESVRNQNAPDGRRPETFNTPDRLRTRLGVAGIRAETSLLPASSSAFDSDALQTPGTASKTKGGAETGGKNPEGGFDRPTIAETPPAAFRSSSGHSLVPAAIYGQKLLAAKKALAEANQLGAVDPEKGMLDALRAVEMFRELGQAVPSEAYWIISRAYASQSWGETLVEHSPPIETMAVSPDSRWLMTRNDDDTVWIWDILRTQKKLEGFKLDAGNRAFVKILFTPDFRWAVGGEADGTIRIWNATPHNPAESVITLGDKVRGLRELRVSPDGRWLVACGGADPSRQQGYKDGDSALLGSTAPWNPPTERTRYADGANPDPASNALEHRINRLRFHIGLSDGIPLSQADFPRGTSLRPMRSGALRPASSRYENRPPRSPENRIALVHYQGTGFGGSVDGSGDQDDSNVVWLWDLYLLKNGVVPQPILLRGHEKPVRVLQISDDSRWLLTGGDDATARIYNLKGAYPGADQAVLKGHQFGITAALFSPDGRWVATGGRDNTVRVWTLPDSKQAPVAVTLGGHVGWISSLATDAAGERLVSGSYDKTVRVWSIPREDIEAAAEQDPVVISCNHGPVRRLLLTHDGRMLVSLEGNAGLRIQCLENDADKRQGVSIYNRMLPITAVSLTPDHRWLVFNYLNRRDAGDSGVRLWPLRFDDLVESAAALVR